MAHKPGTAGRYAAQLAEKQMEPFRKYLRERAGRTSEVAKYDQAKGREEVNTADQSLEGG